MKHADMSRGARLAAHSAVSTSLALRSDHQLRDLVEAAVPLGSGIGGRSMLLEVDGTPVFLGCGDADPVLPRERVDETEALLVAMDARVGKRVYPGLGHDVNEDEIEFVRRMMAGLLEFSE